MKQNTNLKKKKTTYLLFKLLVVCVFMSASGFGLLSFQSKGDDLKDKDKTDVSEVRHA